MKRTRTAKKIKASRSSADWVVPIILEVVVGRSPLSLPPLPPTTSTRPNLKLFTGLATLVALGSIPGSDASAPQRDWQSRAVDCVKTDGSWNANTLECTGQRGLSTNTRRVTNGLDCVINKDGSWNPALGGYCHQSFKPKRK